MFGIQTGEAGEESSDSDGEQEETSHKLIRKVSTSGQIRAKVGRREKLVIVLPFKDNVKIISAISLHI